MTPLRNKINFFKFVAENVDLKKCNSIFRSKSPSAINMQDIITEEISATTTASPGKIVGS